MEINIPLGELLQKIEEELKWKIDGTEIYKKLKEQNLNYHRYEYNASEAAHQSIKETAIDCLAEYLVEIALQRAAEKIQKESS